MTTLPGANTGWRGRHVGCFGIPDSFWGGNGDATGDELSLGPANVSTIRKNIKNGGEAAYGVSLVGDGWLASSAALLVLVFL